MYAKGQLAQTAGHAAGYTEGGDETAGKDDDITADSKHLFPTTRLRECHPVCS